MYIKKKTKEQLDQEKDRLNLYTQKELEKDMIEEASKFFNLTPDVVEEVYATLWRWVYVRLNDPRVPWVHIPRFIDFRPNPQKAFKFLLRVRLKERQGRFTSEKARYYADKWMPMLIRISHENRQKYHERYCTVVRAIPYYPEAFDWYTEELDRRRRGLEARDPALSKWATDAGADHSNL